MASKKKPKESSKLDDMLADIQSKYGATSVGRLTDRKLTDVETLSSESLLLDWALGVGGYPRGRIIEIYGPEASGKTTLTLHAMAGAQRRGHQVAFIDAEHALDVNYARTIGVDIDKLIFSQPDCGEQALNIAEALAQSGSVSLVVIDSVAALTPKSEIEGDIGDHHVGAQARMMSQALRKLAGVCSKTGTTVMFINQLRQKIGVMFGSPETTPGGQALKFYASVRLDVRRSKQIKEGDSPIGNNITVKVVKNKLAPPFKTAHLEIVWGKGVDHMSDLVSIALQLGVLSKSGAWYSYGDTRIGQGFVNACKFFKDNGQVRQEVELEVREAMLLQDHD